MADEDDATVHHPEEEMIMEGDFLDHDPSKQEKLEVSVTAVFEEYQGTSASCSVALGTESTFNASVSMKIPS
jgi:hypothetical protein